MELILANHSSYPRIGDEADMQVLRRAIARFEKQEIPESELKAAEDRMVDAALAEQAEAGLDVVTDGLIRWYDPISHLAGKLAGVRINGLLRFFDTNFYFRQPVITGKLARARPLVVEEHRYAQSKSSKSVKAVLTGPLTLARHSIIEDGKSEGSAVFDALTAALAEEVGALAASGAKFIQIDEPSLLRAGVDWKAVHNALASLAAKKGAAELALAVYFGDPAPVHDELQKLPVDALLLDFTYTSNLEKVVAAGSQKTLGLGLVDARNTKLEDGQALARRIERIARRSKEGRAYLLPSCGLEYLPRERARQKLRTLADARKAFLGGAR